jgi:hypothetical protein
MEMAEMDLDSWYFRFKNEHQRTTGTILKLDLL